MSPCWRGCHAVPASLLVVLAILARLPRPLLPFFCAWVQAAVAEYSSQVQQWAERVRQLEAAAAAGPASTGDAVARLAALQQQASEAEVHVTSLQAENRALREQVGPVLGPRI